MPARAINREVFITCAVTGAGETTAKHPGVPVTPEQIANAAIESAKAGAAIAHCHVRDPVTGKGSRDIALYREVFNRIRASDTDVVINFTAGMGSDVGFGTGENPAEFDKELTDLVGPMARLPHIEELRPEICTLDCGSMNFGEGDFIVMNTPNLLRTMAKRIKEVGVKPECEVFDTGHLWFVNQLVKEGLLADPPMVQLCLGIPYGAPADIGTAKAMVDNLPTNAIFSGFAISRDQMPFVAGMPLLGGNVRVGLEDNLYLSRGVLATNAQLVEKAKGILEAMGCKVIGPADVRKKLGLVKHCSESNPYSAPLASLPLEPRPTPSESTRKRSRSPRRVAEPKRIQRVAVVGGGVIGGGWAARFSLNGIDVAIVDPDPQTERKVLTVVADAERAYSKLTLAPLGKRGKITFLADLAAGVADADFIQECLPEREELKRKVLAQIDLHARPDVVIGSSTSGILPSSLQADMSHPERLVVTHPFNPVYLLPLVEVCGGSKTSEDAKKRAAEVCESIGMHPLLLGVEVPGFVSDRLLEALWREALHLVNDGVATTSQIDEAICYGPGLRWSFMGSFLTYRLGGGEGGMRAFMKMFGPALKLPWTKLVAPEMTDELAEKIAQQSDEQAEGASIQDLVQRRDDCLVAVMHALRDQDCGAGSVLKKYEKKLYCEQSHTAVIQAEDDVSKPLCLHRATVKPEWIDYNGHMTESRYLQVFGDGTDALLHYVGVNSEYLAKGFSYYTVETHIMQKKEVASGAPLVVKTQLLKVDEKRIHLFHTLEGRDEVVLASAEQMLLHVNTKLGRACEAEQAIITRLTRIADAHKHLPCPKEVGRSVGAPRS